MDGTHPFGDPFKFQEFMTGKNSKQKPVNLVREITRLSLPANSIRKVTL